MPNLHAFVTRTRQSITMSEATFATLAHIRCQDGTMNHDAMWQISAALGTYGFLILPYEHLQILAWRARIWDDIAKRHHGKVAPMETQEAGLLDLLKRVDEECKF